ncbi:hypothetical protein [Actinophytocola sp.]|uniref:hypothetical protein n=1 Tax=Actinophytocola sp. TaxID=1872138 RepID=UPI002ED43D4B
MSSRQRHPVRRTGLDRQLVARQVLEHPGVGQVWVPASVAAGNWTVMSATMSPAT